MTLFIDERLDGRDGILQIGDPAQHAVGWQHGDFRSVQDEIALSILQAVEKSFQV
ncbi:MULTISPECIES: hypothetical protein [unclassified Methylobacterium]|uniref:hypothetical protein n=1 Tax=unclassified Methylobacterium TaxID=2615210 RepID=UPI0012E35861|nr:MULTISPECIES: hypothetical protein [unclassified Methylobacterium]